MDDTLPVAAAKFGVGLLVTGGTSKIVKSIVDNNVQTESKLEAIELALGVYVLSSIVGAAARKHTGEKIDNIAKFCRRVKDKSQSDTESTPETESQAQEA